MYLDFLVILYFIQSLQLSVCYLSILHSFPSSLYQSYESISTTSMRRLWLKRQALLPLGNLALQGPEQIYRTGGLIIIVDLFDE